MSRAKNNKQDAAPEAPNGWHNRIVGTADVPPDELLFNPYNWRIHPGAQQDALAGILDRIGWVRRILVNKRTGHVVDGHLRAMLASRRGEKTVPVEYVDLSETEELAVLASIDPLADLAATDQHKLNELLEYIEGGDPELDALLRSINDLPEVDDDDELEDGFGDDNDPDTSLADVSLVFGEYRAIVTRASYQAVINDIREAHGFDAPAVVAQLLSRLGVDNATASN